MFHSSRACVYNCKTCVCVMCVKCVCKKTCACSGVCARVCCVRARAEDGHDVHRLTLKVAKSASGELGSGGCRRKGGGDGGGGVKEEVERQTAGKRK